MITLDEITNFYLDQHQRPQSQYRRVSTIGIRGFGIFWRDSTGMSSTITLPVLANKTSVMPSDLQTIIQIGILNQKGEFASLTLDSNLSLGDSTNSGRTSQQVTDTVVTNEDIIFSYQDTLLNVPSQSFELLGVGSTGVIGYYRPNWQSRAFVYDFKFHPTEVILEYIGLPETNDGDYFVDDIFLEAMIAYIAWQDAVGNPKASRAERMDLKALFDMEYRNARISKDPINPSDLFNQFRRDVRGAVKS